MTDLIIGCYTNYNWDQIKTWANSIEQSGFSGDKAMIVYNSDFATVQKLLDKNFSIYAFNRNDETGQFQYPGNFSVVVQRFYHLWQFVTKLPPEKKYKNIIATDVKDVIFQADPSPYLAKNLKSKKILVSSESLTYQNEAWGDENLRNSFPMVYNWMSDKEIWNCGVLAGNIEVMKDLFLQIYLTSIGNPIHNPDQAALNILLNLEPFKSITKFVRSEDGWACQAGTTVDPEKIEKFKPHLLEVQPAWDGEFVTTSTGIRYPIVHQWDRIPEWKAVIAKKYSGE